MNRIIASLFVSSLLLTLCGCKHEPPKETVYLLDISKSITPDSVQYEFKVADGLVDRMHRGDRLTIIPITGSAISETPGHVLYFSAPVSRQPYDHDLVVFREQAHEQIEAMRDAAIAHPSNRTDILGALDLARQEFEMDSQERSSGKSSKTLIVLSDFLEDDGTYRFVSGKVMAGDGSALLLATQLKKKHDSMANSVHIYAGGLASTDLRHLDPERQHALCTFWSAYLAPIMDAGLLQAVLSGDDRSINP